MFEGIKDKKLILIGETHGTKEIPELLSKFFSELVKKEEFNICFEIPEEFGNNFKEYFEKKEFGDGKNSKEYFELIKKLKNLNVKIIFVAPNEILNQKDLEDKIAENIMKNLEDKKTFVILGDVHASKNLLEFGKMSLIPAGLILFDRLKEDLFSLRIVPKSGEFFNFGIKKIDKNILDEEFNKNFDYVYEIDKVSSCSFLKD